MPRSRRTNRRISVFKGRKARLNLAIFKALKKESPLIIYDITKIIREEKGFKRTRFANVGRRLKALVKQGFIQKVGTKVTQPGSMGNLYQLTSRAEVALIYRKISRDKFIKEANEETLSAELAALKLFLKKSSANPEHKQSKTKGTKAA